MGGAKSITAMIVACGALWSCAGAPKTVGPATAADNAAYTQTATGMRYPPAIGAFKRVAITRYAADGSDESVGYNRETPGTEISATVYVYPSPSVSKALNRDGLAAERARKCTLQMQTVLGELNTVHRDAVLVREGDVKLMQAGVPRAGRMTLHKYAAPFDFFGRNHPPLLSETYLFCYVGGKWSVEYRIDYPREYDARADIDAFMRDLKWTIRRTP